MKYFALPNLNWLDVEEVDPPTLPKLTEYPEGKNAFRDWCNDKATKHCFFSCVEGIDPYHRVTVDNPAFKMYGLVVDYDETFNWATMTARAERTASDLRPRWASLTYSGNARLVWEFEKPVMVDNEEIYGRFRDLLIKTLNCDGYSAAMDPASFKLAQYFELGKDWKEIPDSQAIPAATVEAMLIKAATAKTIKGEVDIPLEHVAKEVEARYPGRWVGEFKEGARGPLFWLNDNIDRVGCQVGTFGMLCYSARAGKSFLHWGEIFGPDFVRQFEAERIGAAADGLWFDGQKYWRQNEELRWNARNKDDTIMFLKGQGVSSVGKTGFASDAEKVLLTAQSVREVKGAVPIVHDSRELVMINGEKYLNTSAVTTCQPAESATPADFPWIFNCIQNAWMDPRESQRDHFLAWLHYFYKSAFNGRPQQGHAIFIAGPRGSGKTFFNFRVLGGLMGGKSDATNYLLGKTNFNKNNAEVGLWALDDSSGTNSWEDKAAFAASIKKHVANPVVRCEGKNQNAFEIPWSGRIVATCNTDNESLEIIPQLNKNNRDKISLFLWDDDFSPHFLPGNASENIIAGELPFFARWLLDWKAPPYVLNAKPRFWANSYHHPRLMAHSNDSSAPSRLAELLDEWKKNFTSITSAAIIDQYGGQWMTATKLRKELAQDPSARDALKEFSRNRMATALEGLGPEYVMGVRSVNGMKEYHIRIKAI